MDVPPAHLPDATAQRPGSIRRARRGRAAAVLVMDGDQRAALAAVRSLGRAGYRPFVCSPRARSLAGASRYARAQAPVPDPLHEPEAFLTALHELVERWGIDVLLPIAEPSLLAVLAARDDFAHTVIPFPDIDTFRDICDKKSLLDAARLQGIAVPEQLSLDRAGDAQALDMAALRFPLVLKPARSVADGPGGRVKLGVSHAANPAELRARLADLPEAAFPVLLQQRIVGPGIGIFVLNWQGRELAAFAHRRLREKPPSGGVSVYRESVPIDPDLLRRSRALLDHFDWQGVAMVEYKVDSATGTPYLMEINGRFWGSLQLAIDAGVDFPVLLIRAARGEEPQPPAAYRTGVRSRWWWGDVDQLLTCLRRSREALSLPPDAPSRWRSILDFLILWRPGDRNEIFRWSDPAPLGRETLDWFARR